MTTTARPGLAIWCGVFGVHLALAVAMTHPAVLYLHSDLFGAMRGDKYVFLWNFWWVKHALLLIKRMM